MALTLAAFAAASFPAALRFTLQAYTMPATAMHSNIRAPTPPRIGSRSFLLPPLFPPLPSLPSTADCCSWLPTETVRSTPGKASETELLLLAEVPGRAELPGAGTGAEALVAGSCGCAETSSGSSPRLCISHNNNSHRFSCRRSLVTNSCEANAGSHPQVQAPPPPGGCGGQASISMCDSHSHSDSDIATEKT